MNAVHLKIENRSYEPRGRGNNYRQNNNKRNENYRKATSAITEKDLSEELKKKLFPGIKTLQTAKAIEICITTRQIGFGTMHVFATLQQFNNIPVPGDIYELYRIGLAVLHVKMILAQRGVAIFQKGGDNYAMIPPNEDLVSKVKPLVLIPDQLSSVINAIGQVATNGTVYVPKYGRFNYTRAHQFIPQAEQINFMNLRDTVVSLADVQTPVEFRRRFYRNSPLPAAVWQGAPDNPVLMNADMFIPANYDLQALDEDIAHMRVKLNFLNKKARKYYSHIISFEPGGSKAQLVCNEMGTLRMSDRRMGEDLDAYYARAFVEGDIDKYFNLVWMTTMSEQIDGCINLLGEMPNTAHLRYPAYCNRDESCCCAYSPLRYRALC